ncbi:MAG: quinone oxidoreductase family protein [Alkalilacustris sp.]
MDYAMIMPRPGGPELFERRDIDVGDPGEGEVRVRHTAIGLNYLDVYHRSGAYPWPVERDLVAGSEAAGVIEAVGRGVTGLEPGDRVAYTHPMNAYCSARVLPAHRLVKLPDAITDDIAATLMLKGLTAHYLIHSTFRVERGMDVLVHAAAGGVGLIMGQWLAERGARAIGTAGGPEKVALARQHGYDTVIDYRAGDFVEPVRAATDGKGVHVVYDGVGADTWRGSLECLRIRGSFVCFGAASGKVEGFGLADLNKGSFFATRPTLFHHIADPAELAARAVDLFAVVQSGAVRSAVSQSFALADVGRAHAALEGRKTTGATVLIP